MREESEGRGSTDMPASPTSDAACVNLVIISHSALLADGVCEIAQQMAGDTVTIAAVGGMQDEDGHMVLGTDPLRIAEALRSLWTPAGVLLLVDMGSAVLSAEVALAMLPATQLPCCRISNAPLVEGAIVAAVEAGLGHTLEQVNAAAEASATLRKV